MGPDVNWRPWYSEFNTGKGRFGLGNNLIILREIGVVCEGVREGCIVEGPLSLLAGHWPSPCICLIK
jgi:hypothetical protein